MPKSAPRKPSRPQEKNPNKPGTGTPQDPSPSPQREFPLLPSRQRGTNAVAGPPEYINAAVKELGWYETSDRDGRKFEIYPFFPRRPSCNRLWLSLAIIPMRSISVILDKSKRISPLFWMHPSIRDYLYTAIYLVPNLVCFFVEVFVFCEVYDFHFYLFFFLCNPTTDNSSRSIYTKETIINSDWICFEKFIF